jgi:Cof subfamily protein (haloacid dehalogenase superfamily)
VIPGLTAHLPDIGLLALDLDGTLMDDDMVIKSARVRQAIAQTLDLGLTVTLATGRMLDFVTPYAQRLNITAPLICYQGGLIQALGTDEPIYRATMDSDLVRQVLALRARHGWHLVLYADNDVFLDEQRHPDVFYRSMLGERLVWVDEIASVLDRHVPIKFLIFVEPHAAASVMAGLRDAFGARIEITQSHARIVEGSPPGVSKGDALRRLADHLAIPQAQVMAIGDQDNDATMIDWAGIGVAMGNGSPATKAVAEWIAPSVAEEGAAVAIERFILNAQGNHDRE